MRALLLASAFASSVAISDEPTHQTLRNLIGEKGIYTLVNLHPNEDRLYAVNYQQRGLIPLCSEVTFLKIRKSKLIFKVNKTEMEYEYLNHDAAAESFPKHLFRFFGTECNTSKVEELGKTDQEGIRQGIVIEGMTKEGVIFAIGYPPRHMTPDTDVPNWMYWQNRFNKFIVHFDKDGKVSRIQH